MQLKVLVTGKNRKVATDLCEHLEADRGYTTIKCDPSKTALFDIMISELPRIVIICLGDETSVSVQAYNVMRTAIRQGKVTTIVVTDAEDEKLFIKYTELERVLFLSRPVSLFALYAPRVKGCGTPCGARRSEDLRARKEARRGGGKGSAKSPVNKCVDGSMRKAIFAENSRPQSSERSRIGQNRERNYF